MTTLTRAQVRELDRRAIEEYGVPGVVLMENAGRGAAEVLMRLNPERKEVAIYCGPGNNGGDGFVIARHLSIHGWPVEVNFCGDPSKLKGDAAVNYIILAKAGLLPDLRPGAGAILEDRTAWIVDAVLGTGLTGPIGEPLRGYPIAAINKDREYGVKVLAIDIPSGLDCDTGKPLGPTVRADHTVTFVAPKAGFANPEAKEWLGEVHVVGIGAPRALLVQYGIS